jgi:hypothetical protein
MGASAGGQRLPSGGLAGQGGSTPVGDAVRNIGSQGGRQGGFGSPISNFGKVGQVATTEFRPTSSANIFQPQTSQNPDQQAAAQPMLSVGTQWLMDWLQAYSSDRH